MDLNKLKEIQAVVFDMDGLMTVNVMYRNHGILQENVWDMDRWGIILSIHWEQTLQIVRNISWNITEMIFHLINFWMDTEMHIMN